MSQDQNENDKIKNALELMRLFRELTTEEQLAVLQFAKQVKERRARH